MGEWVGGREDLWRCPERHRPGSSRRLGHLHPSPPTTPEPPTPRCRDAGLYGKLSRGACSYSRRVSARARRPLPCPAAPLRTRGRPPAASACAATAGRPAGVAAAGPRRRAPRVRAAAPLTCSALPPPAAFRAAGARALCATRSCATGNRCLRQGWRAGESERGQVRDPARGVSLRGRVTCRLRQKPKLRPRPQPLFPPPVSCSAKFRSLLHLWVPLRSPAWALPL